MGDMIRNALRRKLAAAELAGDEDRAELIRLRLNAGPEVEAPAEVHLQFTGAGFDAVNPKVQRVVEEEAAPRRSRQRKTEEAAPDDATPDEGLGEAE